jgi:hypothetical protein
LNFKEMMLRSASAGAGASASSTASAGASATIPVVVYSKQSTIIPQKSLSSSNIFLAAFQNQDDANSDSDADCDVADNNANAYGSVVASSVLIDSCDKKYDRLYR